MTDGHLRVGDFLVPASELTWSFDTSGGPGGQHANRSATRVTVRFDVATSQAFPPEIRDSLARRIGGRLQEGGVTVTVDDTRSQWRNRAIARKRLAAILEEALVPQKRRRATFPGRRAHRRRLEEKRRRGLTKRLRRRPDEDD